VRVSGLYAYHYRRVALALAVVLAVAAGVYGVGVFDRTKPFGFSDPDSESARAYDLLESATGAQTVPGVLLVVRAAGEPANSATGRADVEAAATELASIDGLRRVVTPATDRSLFSADRQLALIEGYLDEGVDDPAEVGRKVVSRLGGEPGVTAGGPAVAADQLNEATVDDLREIELAAAPLLVLITLLVFRSLVAAMLPILVGGISIAFTLAGLRALSEVMEIDIFALNVVTVLGLGLAIDYSLFMVSRYREEIAASGPGSAAVGAAMVRVGRMIAFSAAIVSISVAALALFPQRFLYSTGVGCALVAMVSAVVVVVVLPAVLAILGDRVNALSLSRDREAVTRSPRWRALARLVLRRAPVVAIAVTVAMVACGLPFLRAELTRADARVLPQDTSAREVDNLVRREFPSDPLSSLLLVDARTGKGAARRLDDARRELRGLAGVEGVRDAEVPGPARALELRIAPGPYSDRALDLVGDVRDLAGGVLVTGVSAELTDQRASLREHLPLAAAVIVAATVIALLLMTGSLILPLIAVVANMLTISVALGALVLLFQDGRLEDLLSYEGVGAIDISIPILLFAVIFGLSTDYGVFLLSRITEARRGGASDDAAIAVGLERTGHIITAAAVLFAVVMGAFIFSRMIFIKEVAVGTALAVIVDATLVRALLFPSLMKLCGRATWWGPGARRRTLSELRPSAAPDRDPERAEGP
jgi:uncharacterized membrane protein YdfJ with MMPL/SSD domain